VELADQPFRQLLEKIGAKTPTPGGGAVASMTVALAAALAQMVLNYSLGKKSLAAHETANAAATEKMIEARERALHLAEADAIAYARLNELWKLDQNDPRRVAEFPKALDAAIAAPQAVLALALDLLGLFQQMTSTTNTMLRSDLAIAALLAEAAARSAAWNVRINLPQVGDAARKSKIEAQLDRHLQSARSLCEAIELACT
jgi:methenyltetrahydrofolate cyclohydrolase